MNSDEVFPVDIWGCIFNHIKSSKSLLNFTIVSQKYRKLAIQYWTKKYDDRLICMNGQDVKLFCSDCGNQTKKIICFPIVPECGLCYRMYVKKIRTQYCDSRPKQHLAQRSWSEMMGLRKRNC